MLSVRFTFAAVFLVKLTLHAIYNKNASNLHSFFFLFFRRVTINVIRDCLFSLNFLPFGILKPSQPADRCFADVVVENKTLT